MRRSRSRRVRPTSSMSRSTSAKPVRSSSALVTLRGDRDGVGCRATLDIVVRYVHRAEVLSIGSELTVGETRDTNAGELARDLSAEGVTVGRLTAVPDDLDVVVDAWRGALARADLVVSTGGLGPTPDDLTREATA